MLCELLYSLYIHLFSAGNISYLRDGSALKITITPSSAYVWPYTTSAESSKIGRPGSCFNVKVLTLPEYLVFRNMLEAKAFISTSKSCIPNQLYTIEKWLNIELAFELDFPA